MPKGWQEVLEMQARPTLVKAASSLHPTWLCLQPGVNFTPGPLMATQHQ